MLRDRMLNRESCEQIFIQVFAEFCKPGNRNVNLTRGTGVWWNGQIHYGGIGYWGRAAGWTADDVIALAHREGITNRDGCIRQAFANCERNGVGTVKDGTATAPTPPPPVLHLTPPPMLHPTWVRDTLSLLSPHGRGHIDDGYYHELCPVLDLTPREQTAAVVRAMFKPDEIVHLLDMAMFQNGVPGENIRTAEEWVRLIESGATIPYDGFLKNPLTGGTSEVIDKHGNAKQSYITNETIKAFPYLHVEFDSMPLQDQRDLWYICLMHPRTDWFRRNVVTIVESGSKSLHAVIYTGCDNLPGDTVEERAEMCSRWKRLAEQLKARFASDDEHHTVADGNGKVSEVYPYRCDESSFRPRQATRLGGASRRKEGKNHGAVQRVLFLQAHPRRAGVIGNTFTDWSF